MTAAEGTPAPETANVLACYSPTVYALLRKRARRAQWMSWGVLGVIVIMLVAGSVVIVKAPSVFEDWSYDVTPNYTYGYGGEYYPSDNVSDNSASSSAQQTSRDLALQRQMEKLQKRLELIEKVDADQTLQIEVMRSKSEGFESQLSEVKKAMEAVKELPKQEVKHWEALLGAFATRFGFAALMVLLMRFMSSIYRYHARMAAFYDAKADVFEACKDGDVQTMEKLSHMLTPVAVDFYETSDTIVEHAVDLAKRAASSHS